MKLPVVCKEGNKEWEFAGGAGFGVAKYQRDADQVVVDRLVALLKEVEENRTDEWRDCDLKTDKLHQRVLEAIGEKP